MERLLISLVACLFVVACSNQSDSDPAIEKEEATANANFISDLTTGGVFLWDSRTMEEYFDEYFLDKNNQIGVVQKLYRETDGWIEGRDKSYTEGGILNYLMEPDGWKLGKSVESRAFSLSDNGKLVSTNGTVDMEFNVLAEVDLTDKNLGNSLHDILGEEITWGSDLLFSQGAKAYVIQREFSRDSVAIESEWCGTDCMGILSYGPGSLDDWLQSHLHTDAPNVANGFYWLGLSLFFDEEGTVYAYKYFWPSYGLLSAEGSWHMESINGEELLQISLPYDVKEEMGIRTEVNPFMTIAEGTRFKGTRRISTGKVPEQYRGRKDIFYNDVAQEDVKNYLSKF
ncbi:hypothetical protein [Hahella sp. CCB-MM4]|uniref:hypothetical protein n=1 Tax=Hahella sp. (strain CCB-MM4) TaxID=1926491 RepID=UPI0011404540|nr:hypothetical protein [Hahella sp. CCB-MM4]